VCIRGLAGGLLPFRARDNLGAVDEEPRGGTEGAEGAEPPISPLEIPSLPPELSTREQELRALIEAGAASPEELRELAAKLKEQRSYEESLWARDVRPALVKARKKRPSIVDLRREGVDGNRTSLALAALLLVAVLVLLLIATLTSFLVLIVAALGVLVYAWIHGLRSGGAPAPDAPPPDPAD